MINTAPWILWLIITMVTLLSTRNPIYLLIILISLFILGNMHAQKKHQSYWLTQNLRFLLTMVLLSTVINSLFSHTGRTILFKIPENWLLIGGNITLESLVYGAINGMIIGALYLVFNIINLVLSIQQVTRLIPNTFHPIAMMVTIALTFFPSIQQRAREIKEAQMIRGNPMKNIADWLPLLIPLLVTSLENAILLSESMTARGFHTHKPSKNSDLAIIGLICSTFAVFAGWILHLYDYPGVISLILYSLGGLLVLLTLIISGRHIKITRYHRETWKTNDILATFILASVILGLIILRLAGHLPTLSYTPYPGLSVPILQISGIILSLIPILPLLFKAYD